MKNKTVLNRLNFLIKKPLTVEIPFIKSLKKEPYKIYRLNRRSTRAAKSLR